MPNQLYIMVGLSGSGKSYKAKEIAQISNAQIVSTDEMREKLCGDAGDQSRNQQVFENCYREVKELLSSRSVVFDATNLSIKDRKQIIQIGKHKKARIVVYVMTTPYAICFKQNFSRVRQIPQYVLEKQLSKFQIPFIHEGFDEIILQNWSHLQFPNEGRLGTIQKQMEHFDQQNPHHKFTLLDHCIYCSHKVTDLAFDEEMPDKEFCQTLGRAAAIHDIGKPSSQSFDKDGIAHYYEHHNIGAYALLQNIDLIPADSYSQLLDILFYVNYHMLPFFWKEEKTHKKYRETFGPLKYRGLMLLNEADQFTSQNKFILE